jgi:ubiquinone/menaquinone biosynthesis C-methylase UbiE
MPSDEKSGKHRQHPVFDASRAEHLDTRLRRFIYRPARLANRYVKPGDRVLDFGCGPGFFTREFAKVVGDSGRVIAVDLQEEMLRIVRGKMQADGLLPRITLHQCKPDSINLPEDQNETFDAAFTIFVVHEVPDPEKLFREISTLLKPGGILFFSEPPFIVSGREFADEIALAEDAGFRHEKDSWFFVNRAAVLRKS